MTDLDKAIAAAREAAGDNHPPVAIEFYNLAREYKRILRDLLDALDAARGQAVAYALPKALAETRADGFTVVRAGHQHHADGTYCVPVYLAPPAAAVPEGYALVPVEPTGEMVLAGERELDRHDFLRLRDAYRAMLAAANKENTNG